ncbi:MAG: hypothetical protein P8X86_07945 [Desulfofustis sp.]
MSECRYIEAIFKHLEIIIQVTGQFFRRCIFGSVTGQADQVEILIVNRFEI